MKNHYDCLKVSQGAPPEVIAAAYRALAKKHHPDRNNQDPQATGTLQVLNEAYEVLSDPVKRAEHDKLIAEVKRLESIKQGYDPSPRPSPPPTPHHSQGPAPRPSPPPTPRHPQGPAPRPSPPPAPSPRPSPKPEAQSEGYESSPTPHPINLSIASSWRERGINKFTFKLAFIAVAMGMAFLAESLLIDVKLGIFLLALIVGMRIYNIGASSETASMVGATFGLSLVALSYMESLSGVLLLIALLASVFIFAFCAIAKERRASE